MLVGFVRGVKAAEDKVGNHRGRGGAVILWMSVGPGGCPGQDIK